jgi:GNAT superfamily N-acetyltransferase
VSIDFIGRFFSYFQRHGLYSTGVRVLVGCKRAVTGNALVLFSCDLRQFDAGKFAGPNAGHVERKRTKKDLEEKDFEAIASGGYAKSIRRQVCERFERGANLWVFRKDGRVAGYGWTIQGETILPHFFPLEVRDVHLFDFFVFPEYRGQGINVQLMHSILAELAGQTNGRAFIEAAEWNTSQLRSLRKTPFQRLGCARKYHFCGKTWVRWDDLGGPERNSE